MTQMVGWMHGKITKKERKTTETKMGASCPHDPLDTGKFKKNKKNKFW